MAKRIFAIYLKLPQITTRIPRPLISDTWSPKYKVPKQTRSTCLTLAAIHKVRGDVILFAIKLVTFRENDRIPDKRTTAGAALDASGPSFDIISLTSPIEDPQEARCQNAKIRIKTACTHQ